MCSSIVSVFAFAKRSKSKHRHKMTTRQLLSSTFHFCFPNFFYGKQKQSRVYITVICDANVYIINIHIIVQLLSASSPPRHFPTMWGRPSGLKYHYSTLSFPVRPPPLTPHFPHLFTCVFPPDLLSSSQYRPWYLCIDLCNSLLQLFLRDLLCHGCYGYLSSHA